MCLARAALVHCCNVAPSMRISPETDGTDPTSVRTRDDLPAPLAPITARQSPASKRNETLGRIIFLRSGDATARLETASDRLGGRKSIRSSSAAMWAVTE